MSTMMFINIRCAICGTTSGYPDIGVHIRGKPDDLDSRPGGTGRSSIYMMIKRCVGCGYCSPDITAAPSRAAHIITEPVYTAQLKNRTYPDTANAFLCWAVIQSETGFFPEAGYAALYAAWICDDAAEYRDGAAECRRRAIDYFIQARTAGQSFSDDTTREQLLLIDLYRRTGEFDDAAALCDEELSHTNSDDDELILVYQKELCMQKDAGRHTLFEALGR